MVARKPLAGTVAGNVLAHGTGALNIEATRTGTSKDVPASPSRTGGVTYEGNVDGSLQHADGTTDGFDPDVGRWPTNLVLSHASGCVEQEGLWVCVQDCPVRLLDAQSGDRPAGGKVQGHEPSRTGQNGIYGTFGRVENAPYDDAGGASRFFPVFYEAKASAAEREAGLGEFAEQLFAQSQGAQAALHRGEGEYQDIAGSSNGLNVVKRRRNVHPTVKPIDLMRWLVRLVTPPGGIVLDPFTGSGSTGCAAVLEGFEFVGIERDAEYVRIAQARIRFWAEHPTGLPVERALTAERERERHRARGQLDIFG